MAILVNSGRVAMAIALMAQPFFLAWGSGSPAWDTTPDPETITQTGLVAEVGRHRDTVRGYCVPDDEGVIVTTTGRYSHSVAPTNHIYLRFDYDFEDAAGTTIRELGLFSGGSVVDGLPPGQIYFPVSDVDTPGVLMLLERLVVKLERTTQSRQAFELVFKV